MNLLRSFLFTCTLLACLPLFAIEIYIAPNGNDASAGTKEQPLATMKGARDALRKLRSTESLTEGVTVIIEQGTYFMNEPLVFTAEDAAPAGKEVVFRAASGASVTFSGGMPITHFEKVNDRLWKAAVPEVAHYGWQFDQLYVNDQRAVRARTPNVGQFFAIKAVDETVIWQGPGNAAAYAVQKIKADTSEIGVLKNIDPENLQNAVLTFYHNWDNTRKFIAGFEKDSATFYIAGQGMKPWNKITDESRYFIENYKEALDAPGEWFLQKDGTLYYIPRPGERIEDVEVVAPVLEKFIVLQGDSTTGKPVENITFRDLSFKISGYKMPASGNDPAQAAAPYDAVIQADFANNITFDNCEIAHTGLGAFWFRQACSGNKVTHCYLHDLGAGGVKIGPLQPGKGGMDISKSTIIDNNIIRSGGWVFPCAVGVTIFHASDNQVIHNEIADFRYTGISVGWVWGYDTSYAKRNTIAYNHIHHLGWGELSDMGGVYTLGKSEGTIVTNNTIHHIYSLTYGGWGLYTDEGSTGITMENNLVYACKNSGFHQHYGQDNSIRNNIFAYNLLAQLQATRVEAHNSFNFTNNIILFNSGTLFSSNWEKIKFKSDYNCYWDERTKAIKFGNGTFKEWQNRGHDRHSIIADPHFSNPHAFDFTFRKKDIINKIKFKPFDYKKAGVYGSQQWIKLAQFDPELARQFDEVVRRGEEKQHKIGP